MVDDDVKKVYPDVPDGMPQIPVMEDTNIGAQSTDPELQLLDRVLAAQANKRTNPPDNTRHQDRGVTDGDDGRVIDLSNVVSVASVLPKPEPAVKNEHVSDSFSEEEDVRTTPTDVHILHVQHALHQNRNY